MAYWDSTRHWGPDRDEHSDRPVSSIPMLLDSMAWLKPCRRILDLGCGSGNLVAHLRAQGHDATGITYQASEVANGGRKHGLELVQVDIHSLPFPDSTFDGAVSWDSLEHCVAPFLVLSEARRVVRPGGRLLVRMTGPEWQDCKYHQLVLSQTQMEHLFKLAGWRLVHAIDQRPRVKRTRDYGTVYEAVNDPDYTPKFRW